MKIILLGAAGFIGTNLIIELAKNPANELTVVDRDREYFKVLEGLGIPNIHYIPSDLTMDTDYDQLVAGQDLVYHLVSSTVPTTSNRAIAEELKGNVVLSANLFEACVHHQVNKVVFLSSGGTVYGKDVICPINEDVPTNPISAYGIQKETIEKLLYLYNYMHGLDYRIIRLSNPYGPYQRPNGVLGAVTTFTYKALRGEEIQVYGDGSVVRDFIFIDDAIRGIQTIVNGNDPHRIFNLGCGHGTSIRQVLETIEQVLGKELKVRYTPAREVDVPINFLDIHRYETAYGALNPISLEEGIKKTSEFMKQFYKMD